MATTLKNMNSKRPAGPFNLSHDAFCSDGTCRCGTVAMQTTERSPETGDAGVRQFSKRIAQSLHFHAGETKSALPDTVALCPEIASAIARGELAKL